MRTRFLLLAILFFLFAGCEKDEPQVNEKETIQLQEQTVDTTSTFTLESQKFVSKGRSGVVPAGLYHEGSNSVNFYLIAPLPKHELFSKRVDSINFVKVSPGTGLLIPSNIEIANYDMWVYYDDGTTAYLPGMLARYKGDTYTVHPENSLLHDATTVKVVSMEQVRVNAISWRHIFKPQTTISLRPWLVTFDGIGVQETYLPPNNKNTNAWNPGHIL